MKFGDYLKQKREEKSWTQPTAAAKAAIEQSYLSKLETGKSYPSEEVFTRLVEAYEIDTVQLVETVTARELSKLREIAEIRTLLLGQRTKARRASRGWLLAGVVMVILSGGSFGLERLAKEKHEPIYIYQSAGILGPSEDIEAFDIVFRSPSGNWDETRRANFLRHKQEMTERLDEKFLQISEQRGGRFIQDVPKGRRLFQQIGSDHTTTFSPLRWFLIPALSFLFGALGCFLISFRWR